MIDLVLYAATKAVIRDFAIAQNLLDSNGNERVGVTYFWWLGDGKFLTQNPVYDGNGSIVTPPAFLPGVVMLLRISEATDDLGGTGEQWNRSKVAQYIRNNGTPGTQGGIPYYELNSVWLFRASDVFTFIANNNLPRHEWFGGNQI